MVLTDNITAYCEKQKISKYEFERRCGLSKSMIRKWEAGINRTPTYTTLMKLEAATGVPASDWMKEGAFGKRRHHQTD